MPSIPKFVGSMNGLARRPEWGSVSACNRAGAGDAAATVTPPLCKPLAELERCMEAVDSDPVIGMTAPPPASRCCD